MCWRMCLYGCFVLGIVRTWEVVSVLRKVPRNLGSGVGKVPRFRYAFVWRSSEGVRGNLRAGPTGIRCDALAIRRLGLLRTKTKKLRGEHEGTRIGPLTGHMGRGRTSMTNTRRAKARRRFRNRRFRYVTRAAGRGQRWGYRPKCVSVLACVPLWRWAFLLFELYGRGTRGRPECVSGMAGQALRHNG
ncbi:Uncharacterised protein [Bifidobacterium longum subsp. infantis]|uniref:Uncharacterized protein n=1 Tax=Bifidobacterium longum subsp. infantis TaxID=1682 RepID=A0A564RYK9_BIFLI|nr:Uncharacterised protein [Bifidobacterium longum subsp. infantis]